MKKIIKLTESDLTKIVQRVLNEQGSMTGVAGYGIPGYRQDDFRYQRKPIEKKENINPKNLKLGDGGKKSPKLIPDVTVLQQKLIDLKLLKTDTGKPTGYFGPKTQQALDMYNRQSSRDDNSIGQKTPNSGFILVFAFPDYQPAAENNWGQKHILAPLTRELFGGASGGNKVKLGKMGHGGCVVIDKDGNTTLYEFGRYDGHKTGMGLVKKKNLGKIAKINNGQITNAEQVAKIAKSRTEGDGPNLAMDVVVLSLPDVSAAKAFADVKEREYAVLDPLKGGAMNCGSYALEVAIAGGVKANFACFPQPKGVVNRLKPGLATFVV